MSIAATLSPTPPEADWQGRVARAFSRAAPRYEALAGAQHRMGEVLWSRLTDHMVGQPSAVLDLGCGPGHWSARMASHFGPEARITGLDLAPGMLEVARRRHGDGLRWLCGDATDLPLATASQDLVFSNLAIQWCPDLAQALNEVARVLRPGGRALINTLGPGTLAEVSHAWSRPNRPAALLAFQSPQVHRAAAQLAGFASVEMQAASRRFHYPDLAAVMASIKGIGAQNAHSGPRLKRADLARARRRFDSLRCPDGLPVTYRLLTLVLER
ncbi:methyltransferase domain-containing protein [Halomonas sp. TRM85114]|uniref:methyltransferase domain-containing protein n=1 Tax=Halomonas jincaotanensis TaxID=2810616 RepID=UPI001BD39D05|nr:methyltransferase domain-containing protein [Halomonas jincaotanensis]MBS9403968.1 methyltransferase domain-containing protein [Halomonas jincaotanensis]